MSSGDRRGQKHWISRSWIFKELQKSSDQSDRNRTQILYKNGTCFFKHGAIFQAFITCIIKYNFSYMTVNENTTLFLFCWKFIGPISIYLHIHWQWASDLQAKPYLCIVVHACDKYSHLGTLERNAGMYSFSI